MAEQIWLQTAKELEAQMCAALRAIEMNATEAFVASVRTQEELLATLTAATVDLQLDGPDARAISATCSRMGKELLLYQSVVEQARKNGCLLARVSSAGVAEHGVTWSLHG
jgi:hypothetical protein